jgi:hypothetical protein
VSIRWLDEPEEKDYQAAQSFLSMVLAPASLPEVIAALHAAPLGRWAAKDILRAAGLPPLRPKESAEVAEKLEKIKEGVPISPILLVGGIRDYTAHRLPTGSIRMRWCPAGCSGRAERLGRVPPSGTRCDRLAWQTPGRIPDTPAVAAPWRVRRPTRRGSDHG